MHPLVTELHLWLDHEKVNPEEIMKDDPKLTEAVNQELAHMRMSLAREWDDTLFIEYKILYNALCDVMMCRIMKLKD